VWVLRRRSLSLFWFEEGKGEGTLHNRAACVWILARQSKQTSSVFCSLSLRRWPVSAVSLRGGLSAWMHTAAMEIAIVMPLYTGRAGAV
jgi:hypothetical protein